MLFVVVVVVVVVVLLLLLPLLFIRVLQRQMEKIFYENQQREQATFRKDYLTVGRLQTIKQLIEKRNEFNIHLCVG